MLLIFLGVLAVFFLLAALFIAVYIIYPRPRLNATQSILKDAAQGVLRPAALDALPWQSLRVASPNGYGIACSYAVHPHARGTVIFSHGIRQTRYIMAKYALLFYARGFNVLLYDMRFHGESGGRNTTDGYYEKKDLKSLVDWVVQKNGAGHVIGTMGQSLGAATVLQHLAIDDRVDFAIADCPYRDLRILLAEMHLGELYFPAFPTLVLSSCFAWVLARFRFGQVSPLHEIARVETPVLFIHGDADDFVPPAHSLEMYRAKPGVKDIYLAAGAGHALAYNADPARYAARIDAFLARLKL